MSIYRDRKDIHREYYNKMATCASQSPWEFDPKSGWLTEPYEFCKKWFASKSSQGRKILDYGCGTKALSLDLIAKNGAEITGVDISAESIKFASQRAILLGLQLKSSFEVGDCESTGFRDSSFDFVFSSGVLSYLDIHNAYAELARVIKPDGYVVIVDTLGHNPILNLNRFIKLKRGLTTKWSVDHILKIADVNAAKSYFGKVDCYYFDILSVLLSSIPYLESVISSKYKSSVKKIDATLLKLDCLKKYAFKVVCILSEPRNKTLKEKG